MSSETIRQEREDFWITWGWVWSALFIGIMVLPMLVGFISGNIAGNGRFLIPLTVMLALAWHYGWVVIYGRLYIGRGSHIRAKPLPMSLHMAGIVLFWYLLTLQFSPYFFTFFFLFALFYYFLPYIWAVVGVMLSSIIFILVEAQLSGAPPAWDDVGVWIFLGTVVLSSLFALWIGGIISQSAQRRDLYEKLKQAQHDLVLAERRAGRLAERQRLAHEIHDTLAQGFISIVMNLETAVTHLDPNHKATTYVNLASQSARNSLEQARRVVENLRPEPLELTTSLPEAIEREINRWQQGGTTAVAFTTTGTTLPLPGRFEVALLRAVQEGLANVRKHAGATAVAITLSYMPDRVVLDVADDGKGMEKREERREKREERKNVGAGSSRPTHPSDEVGAGSSRPPTPHQGGYGLIAMQERVEALNGRVSIESDLGEGVTLTVSLPVEREVA